MPALNACAHHQQRLLSGLPGLNPVSRRETAEKLFQHSAWVQRKPGAMWDVVPAPSAFPR